MFNFFKKKKDKIPLIEFIAYRAPDHLPTQERFNELANIYPVRLASSEMPDWWKELPEVHESLNAGFPTAKKCPGIFDYMRSGYIVPAWADIKFRIDSDKLDHVKFKMAEAADQLKRPMAVHSQEQIQGCPINHSGGNNIIKLHSPWLMDVPKGYSVLFVDPMYNKSNDYTILPGRMDVGMDLIQNKEINVFVKVNVLDKDITIHAGEPIVQLIPFKQENFRFNVRNPTKTDIKKYYKLHLKPLTKILESVKDRKLGMKFNRDKLNKNYNAN